MRHIILLIVIVTLFSCVQNETKQKEFELKEKETALKDKELAIAYNDSIKSSLIKPSIQTPEKNEQIELPFVGKKSFNFDGGNSTGYMVTINKKGIVKIEREVSPGYQEMIGATDKDLIVFKGPFKAIIKTKDGRRYKIEADKISMVDAKGNVEKDCGDSGDENCITTY